MLLIHLLACVVTHQPVILEAALDAGPSPFREGPLVHEVVTSARWSVPRKGLIDLDDPLAVDLPTDDAPIVLPVHLFHHPDGRTFVVDTGVSDARVRGEADAARGLVGSYIKDIEAEIGLGSLLEGRQVAAVVLTHTHLDHVLGLIDVPMDVPVYVGPGETSNRQGDHALLKGFYRRTFAGRDLRELPFDDLLGELPATDLAGDGSLWLVHSPGHTPGSQVVIAATKDGPVVVLGDTSHTRWGWDHGVPPGTFSNDPEQGKISFSAMKALVEAHPGTDVFVGHEP